jgi:hypothetical protein
MTLHDSLYTIGVWEDTRGRATSVTTETIKLSDTEMSAV